MARGCTGPMYTVPGRWCSRSCVSPPVLLRLRKASCPEGNIQGGNVSLSSSLVLVLHSEGGTKMPARASAQCLRAWSAANENPNLEPWVGRGCHARGGRAAKAPVSPISPCPQALKTRLLSCFSFEGREETWRSLPRLGWESWRGWVTAGL